MRTGLTVDHDTNVSVGYDVTDLRQNAFANAFATSASKKRPASTFLFFFLLSFRLKSPNYT